MLRRRLLALLLCLFAAGLPLAAQAVSADMHAEHACMHHGGGSATDCSDHGSMANSCAMHCAAGVCVVSNLCPQQVTISSVRPPCHEALNTPECSGAPDTAPPKAARS